MNKRRYECTSLLGLGMVLTAIIILYNGFVYQSHEKGILNDKWYLIFLIMPLLVLVTTIWFANIQTRRD